MNKIKLKERAKAGKKWEAVYQQGSQLAISMVEGVSRMLPAKTLPENHREWRREDSRQCGVLTTSWSIL